MNLAAIFSGSFLIGLSGAVAPGPLLAITVERSFKRGFRAGPLLITGHAILEVGVVVLIMHGLSGIISRPAVDYSLSLAGGALLVFMGAAMLARKEAAGIKSGALRGRGSDIFYGALGSLANPYWSIWWVSIGMAYMALALPGGGRGSRFFHRAYSGGFRVVFGGFVFCPKGEEKDFRKTVPESFFRVRGISRRLRVLVHSAGRGRVFWGVRVSLWKCYLIQRRRGKTPGKEIRIAL